MNAKVPQKCNALKCAQLFKQNALSDNQTHIG